MHTRLRTAHYGLNDVGKQVVTLLARRPDVDIVAALDTDPRNVGRDLGAVVGLGHGLGVLVSYDPELVVSRTEADVVLHATSPYLSIALPQLLPLLASGKSIVSALIQRVGHDTELADGQECNLLSAACRRLPPSLGNRLPSSRG